MCGPRPRGTSPGPPYTRNHVQWHADEGPRACRPEYLLVDDDRDLLVPLAEQLRLDGFDVTTARDGDEALRRLDIAWPDLLIIDLLMPRMDGLTLAREVKARADLPIIVLSAIDAGDNKADLLDEFAEDYVTKPYNMQNCAPGSNGSSGASVSGSRARASTSARTCPSSSTSGRPSSAASPFSSPRRSHGCCSPWLPTSVRPSPRKPS